MEDLAVEPEDMATACATESRRVLDERFEHRLKIERRAADDLEDFAGGGLLLERFAEIVVACLKLGEKSHVLDRDHRLVGKGLEERDLLVGERVDLGPPKRDS
ncbi:MAG TPA: hypothetical protein VK548_30145 [Candidatus Acidoferrum sp.]|nr:hypothetical protein [Candidatus Acidoferrum sp.]